MHYFESCWGLYYGPLVRCVTSLEWWHTEAPSCTFSPNTHQAPPPPVNVAHGGQVHYCHWVRAVHRLGDFRFLQYVYYKLLVDKNDIHLAHNDIASLTASVRTFNLSPLDKKIS